MTINRIFSARWLAGDVKEPTHLYCIYTGDLFSEFSSPLLYLSAVLPQMLASGILPRFFLRKLLFWVIVHIKSVLQVCKHPNNYVH